MALCISDHVLLPLPSGRVGVEGHRVDTLLHEPLGEIRVIRRALTTNANIPGGDWRFARVFSALLSLKTDMPYKATFVSLAQQPVPGLHAVYTLTGLQEWKNAT